MDFSEIISKALAPNMSLYAMLLFFVLLYMAIRLVLRFPDFFARLLIAPFYLLFQLLRFLFIIIFALFSEQARQKLKSEFEQFRNSAREPSHLPKITLFERLGFDRHLSAQRKGERGEEIVADLLSRLDGEKYMILSDLMIPYKKRYAQIDHIVISPYGLFVIETKNMKGWIFGDETGRYWTQLFYQKKVRFFSPIQQNRGHIAALRKVLSHFPYINYIPIIVFPDEDDLKTETKTHVVGYRQLLGLIERYQMETLPSLSCRSIAEQILSVNVTSVEKRERHVERVQNKIHRRYDHPLPDFGECPWCNGKLVPRTGAYGRFLGCSRYPTCRFTKNFNG